MKTLHKVRKFRTLEISPMAHPMNIKTFSNVSVGKLGLESFQFWNMSCCGSFIIASISCGRSEFYVQITFNKPFKGLVYAYKYISPSESNLYTDHYPVQILDTCTLRGNGASVVYLELSFLSECVEKLSGFIEPEVNRSQVGDDSGNPNENILSYKSNNFV